MESGSQIGTYMAYFFVCLFLLVVAIAAARSYGMIMSLVLMVFMGPTKPAIDTANSDTNEDEKRSGDESSDRP